jgi:uncharacterized membrane protein YqaE (UPF0057 family)
VLFFMFCASTSYALYHRIIHHFALIHTLEKQGKLPLQLRQRLMIIAYYKGMIHACDRGTFIRGLCLRQWYSYATTTTLPLQLRQILMRIAYYKGMIHACDRGTFIRGLCLRQWYSYATTTARTTQSLQ